MVMEVKFAYVGIRVKDIEETVRFYTKLLGMKETGRNGIEFERRGTWSVSSPATASSRSN